MLWLHPAAWLGLAAVAAPLLIHLLVHRRSNPLAFPTLQFLRPTRFASIRRHALDDLWLLLARASVIAAAVAALAAPLLTTPARRASWNSRVARAIIVDPGEPGRQLRADLVRQETTAAFRSAIFETPDIGDGLRRAMVWLDDVPLARREIVCISPLAIGTVTMADVAAVPPEIGLRFVQRGSLPQTRTMSGAAVLTSGGDSAAASNTSSEFRAALHMRTVTLTAQRTSVADASSASRIALPLDIIAAPDARPLIDAAVSAVLKERAFAPAAGRTARLLIAGAPEEARIRNAAEAIHAPWMGDAVARVTADSDVANAARDVHVGAAAIGTGAAWQTVASGADEAAIVAAAQMGNQLLIVSAALPADLLTPVLIRSILNALSDPADLRTSEIVPIADSQLRAWDRSPGPARLPDTRRPLDSVSDDRRWMWGAALCLLAIEGWIRGRSNDATDDAAQSMEETDRVA